MPQNFYTECARRLPDKLFSKKKKTGGSCVPYIANLYERHYGMSTHIFCK